MGAVLLVSRRWSEEGLVRKVRGKEIGDYEVDQFGGESSEVIWVWFCHCRR
jgi:hypothetical protein